MKVFHDQHAISKHRPMPMEQKLILKLRQMDYAPADTSKSESNQQSHSAMSQSLVAKSNRSLRYHKLNRGPRNEEDLAYDGCTGLNTF